MTLLAFPEIWKKYNIACTSKFEEMNVADRVSTADGE